jgi:hypothetical protein
MGVVVVVHEFRWLDSLLARSAAYELRSMAQCNGDDLHPCDLHGLTLGACFGALNFGQVGSSPSFPSVTAAYRVAAWTHHPDRHLQSTVEVAKAGQEAFKLASNAYACLKTHFGNPSSKVHTADKTAPHSAGDGVGDTTDVAFRLRSWRQGGTIPGLREGEVELSDVKRHFLKTIKSMVVQGKPVTLITFVECGELHKTPRYGEYNNHVHYYAEFSANLQCKSDLFDVVGRLSGVKLRTHITKIQNDKHAENWITYACKDGNYLASPAPARLMSPVANNKRKFDTVEWATTLLKAAEDAQANTPAGEIVRAALEESHPDIFILQYNKCIDAVVCAHSKLCA